MIYKKSLDYIVITGIILYLLSCIGATFIFLSDYFQLSFIKTELSLGEILNSITAISLAFIIPFIVEKRFNRRKTVSENLNNRLNSIQKELEGLISFIQKISFDFDSGLLEDNKRIINLKLRKLSINISGFKKDSVELYEILLKSFVKFRKLTTDLAEPSFTFNTKFHQDVYIRYIDMDRCIEDTKNSIINNF